MHVSTEGLCTTSCSASCTTLCDPRCECLRSLARPHPAGGDCVVESLLFRFDASLRRLPPGLEAVRRIVVRAVRRSAEQVRGGLPFAASLSPVFPVRLTGSTAFRRTLRNAVGALPGATRNVKFSTTGTGTDSRAFFDSGSGPGTAEPHTDTNTPDELFAPGREALPRRAAECR